MRTIRRILNLGLLGAASVLAAAGPTPPVNAGFTSVGGLPSKFLVLNAKVVAYAGGHLHQKVGSGQCWDLVDSALRAAGADTSGDAAYVFGRPVGLDAVAPGDCLQFEGVSFKHTNADGSWYTNDFPHHSAIVDRVEWNKSGGGLRLKLLSQNLNGDMTVEFTFINLTDRLPGGTIRAYTPK